MLLDGNGVVRGDYVGWGSETPSEVHERTAALGDRSTDAFGSAAYALRGCADGSQPTASPLRVVRG